MEILSYVIETGLLVLLGVSAEMDFKNRALGLNFLCISFTVGFVLETACASLSLWEMLLGPAVGALLGLISHLSRGAVGKGDAFMAAVCGAWLGFFKNVFLLLCSFLIMAVFGMGALVLRKAKVKDSLPFIPFMLAGYVVLLAVY